MRRCETVGVGQSAHVHVACACGRGHARHVEWRRCEGGGAGLSIGVEGRQRHARERVDDGAAAAGAEGEVVGQLDRRRRAERDPAEES
eukprot:494204-Pleurochrysis_carterae.AAC.1